MKMKFNHNTFHSCPRCDRLYPTWNRRNEPTLRVGQNEVFQLVCPEPSNGQVNRNSTAADAAMLDYRRSDPLCGPVYIEGAEPGDALRVEVLDLELGDWGWTAIKPNVGLLAEDFDRSYFRSFELESGDVDIFGERFSLRPMLGVLGVAPEMDGDFLSVTPTKAGGNIDVRYLTKGAVLYLPVYNSGGLLSGSDGHALQGEGEISGFAIEAPITATLMVDVIKSRPLPCPMIDCSTRIYEETEYRSFFGVGTDLMEAAKDSVRFAVDELARALRIEPHEAYAMMGIVGELRIHEIVNPSWVVGCMIPRRFFGNSI
jgi:acetamidase/formamidase